MTHQLNPRRAGVLLHPTSLPGPHGAGDLGPEAYRFLDWITAAGVRSWQILPLVPPGGGDSPYASWSAFAGNPWLVDLRDLASQGLLDPAAFERAPQGDPNHVDFPALYAFKGPLLEEAARRLLADETHPLRAGLAIFRAKNADWLDDATLFAALKHHHDGDAWWTWPAGVRDRRAKPLAEARERLHAHIEQTATIQFFFQYQWDRLHAACTARGVELIGDLPIYVDANSADVWTHRALFQLDRRGRRTKVAGVPPDAFSDSGQLWGNPLYRWDRMKKTGFTWWIARLRRALTLTHRVRIDHFRAFSAYWAVPADAPDARNGEWIKAPGAALFKALNAALGPDLPVLAEDLGIIDADVEALLAEVDLPGMRVLHFAFGDQPTQPYLPHNHIARTVLYLGTHDNDTTRGFWEHTSDHIRHHIRTYFGVSGDDIVWDLIRASLKSVAETTILTPQDLLGYGDWARMNTPGTSTGNWTWRLTEGALNDWHRDRLRDLIALYGRLNAHL